MKKPAGVMLLLFCLLATGCGGPAGRNAPAPQGGPAARPDTGLKTALPFDFSYRERFNPPLPAGPDTLKLPPEFFRLLPGNIKSYLGQRGITIPQSWTHKRAHNIIRGQFTAPGSDDYAALCLHADSIFILVFPQGDTAKPLELAREKADKWEAHYYPGQTAFNRQLRIGTPEELVRSYDFYKDDLDRYESLFRTEDYSAVDTSRIDHQGIVDSYIGLGEGYNYLTAEHNYLWELDYSKIDYDDSTLAALHKLYSYDDTGTELGDLDLFVPALDTLLLPPAYFRKMPKDIVSYLERKNIMIPQVSWGGTARNCISGEFYTQGKTDWAVLCYENGNSYVLVFKDGKTDRIDKILEEPAYIESLVLPEISFSWVLSVADTTVMRKVLATDEKMVSEAKAATIHQGLVHADEGDANYIYYHYQDKWQGPFFYSDWDE
ncbi:hypothetical protein LLH00_12105 [bacterium]|nr:hypothetical protein [bacterium]